MGAGGRLGHWAARAGRALATLLLVAGLAACSGAGTPPAPEAIPSPTPPSLPAHVEAGPRWALRPPATPAPTATPSPTPTPPPMHHTVQAGETLEEIAAAYRVTVVEIMAANDLGRPTGIRVGDVLLIPRPGVTPTPAFPTPTPEPGS